MAFACGWKTFVAGFTIFSGVALAQKTVPALPPSDAKSQTFHDGHFGVRFEIPGGWSLARKDGQVSTFHLDARSASQKAVMRSVASIQFNPYPYSTFSGALFYFSVEPHTTDVECARQATGPMTAKALDEAGSKDVQDIGGMDFAHGHDEHGKICVEARDEVYTAYRKGSCYRFDLALNTFCSISSGAADLTQAQVEQLDGRMTDILSTVTLAWEKGGPHPVPVPKPPVAPPTKPPAVPSVASLGRGDTSRNMQLQSQPVSLAAGVQQREDLGTQRVGLKVQ